MDDWAGVLKTKHFQMNVLWDSFGTQPEEAGPLGKQASSWARARRELQPNQPGGGWIKFRPRIIKLEPSGKCGVNVWVSPLQWNTLLLEVIPKDGLLQAYGLKIRKLSNIFVIEADGFVTSRRPHLLYWYYHISCQNDETIKNAEDKKSVNMRYKVLAYLQMLHMFCNKQRIKTKLST